MSHERLYAIVIYIYELCYVSTYKYTHKGLYNINTRALAIYMTHIYAISHA